MSDQPLNTVSDIKNFRDSRLADMISNIHSALLSPESLDIRKLPENVFVYHFLPWFAGTSTDKNVNAAAWVDIAGSANVPVHIVDNSGEILYTIPPLFDRTIVQTSSADRDMPGMNHVLITFDQLSRISPRRAELYYLQELEKRKILDDKTIKLREKVKFWNDLFKRYGLPLIEVNLKEDIKENKDTPPQLEFDDDIL